MIFFYENDFVDIFVLKLAEKRSVFENITNEFTVLYKRNLIRILILFLM